MNICIYISVATYFVAFRIFGEEEEDEDQALGDFAASIYLPLIPVIIVFLHSASSIGRSAGLLNTYSFHSIADLRCREIRDVFLL